MDPIGRLIINRDSGQYLATSDEKDVLVFEMLVTEELGKDSGKIRAAIFSLGGKRSNKEPQRLH